MRILPYKVLGPYSMYHFNNEKVLVDKSFANNRKSFPVCSAIGFLINTINLAQVFSNDGYPPAYSKSFGRDADDWTKLIPFVFVGIDHFQCSVNQCSIESE